MSEQIILVDENDNQVGVEEKVRAHENGGKLHRSFSIVIFNSSGEVLLQLRSVKKYHFGGLWSNTCCGHPRNDETVEDAAHRRLREEFGFETELKEVFSFVYKVDDPKSELTEWEYDHVFFGKFDGGPAPNPDEIDEFEWVSVEDLTKDVSENPEKYTLWFRIAFQKILESGIELK